ncbi:MAG TPA: 30S ribosomal protein S8 [Patescibacteria group bacterium]|nr:30S ribosomal protein S8 [Patescibacteria group bacterium]
MNYIVADFVSGIKNAVNAKRREAVLPMSKLNIEIGKVLIKEGFLEEVKEDVVLNKKVMRTKLRYDKRTPRFIDAVLISKPSLRKYISSKNIQDIEKRGKKTLIISTSQGVMTGKEAIKKGIGGEILFAIW